MYLYSNTDLPGRTNLASFGFNIPFLLFLLCYRTLPGISQKRIGIAPAKALIIESTWKNTLKEIVHASRKLM